MDRHDISWAVQYELARGVSNGAWTWADITAGKLEKLRPSREGKVVNVAKLQVELGKVMGKQLGGLKPEIW